MLDVVISGTSGFVGKYLASAFTAAGSNVVAYDAFRTGTGDAHTFIHCANAANPGENAALTAASCTTGEFAVSVRVSVGARAFASYTIFGRVVSIWW